MSSMQIGLFIHAMMDNASLLFLLEVIKDL